MQYRSESAPRSWRQNYYAGTERRIEELRDLFEKDGLTDELVGRCSKAVEWIFDHDGRRGTIRRLVDGIGLTGPDAHRVIRSVRFSSCVVHSLDDTQYVVENGRLTRTDILALYSRGYGKDNTYLSMFCKGGKLDVVQYLVETFNINSVDIRSNGNNALYRTCYYGKEDTLSYILENFVIPVDELVGVYDSIAQEANGDVHGCGDRVGALDLLAAKISALRRTDISGA